MPRLTPRAFSRLSASRNTTSKRKSGWSDLCSPGSRTQCSIAGLNHTEATGKMLRAAGIRVAEMMDIDSTPIDIAVGMSHRNAGFDTGVHLIQRGYRRFGYVGHDWQHDRRARLRYDGLVAALGESGLSLVDFEVYDGPSSTQAGRETLATLLKRAPTIDVVVFSNDDMAVGGVFHCMVENIVIKERLALFGFNGLKIAAALPQPLSTIRSHRFQIGEILPLGWSSTRRCHARGRSGSTSATRSSRVPLRRGKRMGDTRCCLVSSDDIRPVLAGRRDP